MSRGFWELLLLLFNSAVRSAETGERSCRGDFPDESLGKLSRGTDRRARSFTDSLPRFGLAGIQLTISRQTRKVIEAPRAGSRGQCFPDRGFFMAKRPIGNHDRARR